MISWELLSQPGFERLAAALIHFLWQGVVIAAIVALLMRCISSRGPHLRYGLLLAGMILMAASPLLTFWLTEAGPMPSTVVQMIAGDHSGKWPVVAEADSVSADAVRQSMAAVSALRMGDGLNSGERTVDDWLTMARPWLLMVWLCGVLMLSARLVLGYAAVRWLMRSRQPISRRLAQITRMLSERIGLHSVPIVAGCERVADAIVVGFVRPMVLLPAAWCTQLSPDVLEAVIAHELAHIRRWDLWVNLMQRLVETMLFYHPAVWWISRRLRAERELCCDAVAVAATGERLRYVEALAAVASAGSHRTPLLLTAQMGGKHMALLNRVRHVLGRTTRERHLDRWSAGAIVLVIPLGLWLAAATMIPVAADEADGHRTGPKETRRSDRDRDGTRAAAPKFRDRDGRAGDRDRPHRERTRGDRRRGDRSGGRRPEGDHPWRHADGPRGERDRDRDHPRRDGRPGEHPRPEQLIRLIQQLREEVRQLRREVDELRGHRRPDGARRPRGIDDGGHLRSRDAERDGDRGSDRRPPVEGRGRRGDRRPDGPPRKRPPRRDGKRDGRRPSDSAGAGLTDKAGKTKHSSDK